MSFNLDRLNNTNPKLAGQAALGALTHLQRFTPEQQVAGAAVLFSLIVKHYGVQFSSALNVSHNLMTKALPNCPDLRAVDNYVKYEL